MRESLNLRNWRENKEDREAGNGASSKLLNLHMMLPGDELKIDMKEGGRIDLYILKFRSEKFRAMHCHSRCKVYSF